MADYPREVFLSGKGTPWEGQRIVGFVTGDHKYYVPQYGLEFTKKADGTFSYAPKRDSYYDSIWRKNVEPANEVVTKAIFGLFNYIATSFNEVV